MAVETITLGTITERVLQIIVNRSSTTADTNLTSEVRWAIHIALRDFVALVQPDAFRRDGVITTASGAATYSLPDDFMQVIEPGVSFATTDFRTLVRFSEMDFRALEIQRAQATGDPTHYLLRFRDDATGQAQITFWPTPTSIRNITVHYLILPTKLYDGVDATIIHKRLPPECHHALIFGACYNLRRYLSAADFQDYEARWGREIERAKANNPPVIGIMHQRLPYGGPAGVGRYYPGITVQTQ